MEKVDIMKVLLSSLIFFIIANAHAARVDTLANCRLLSDQGEESLSSYSVLRDGDRLYAKYRLTEGRDFEETDDIFLKKYEGEDLARLKDNGVLASLSKALKIGEDKIEKISFYGIVEIEDEDDGEDDGETITSSEDDPPPAPPVPPKYLMEIYKVSGSLGVGFGSVGKPHEKDFQKCTGGRYLFFH